MKKIKDYIIRHLGGYTAEEAEQIKNTIYNSGEIYGFTCIKRYMRSLHGIQAEQWCKLTYKYVNDRIASLTTQDVI